jgi:hypothetical protein
MGNLKAQPRSYGNTITSPIRMVRPSSPSTCVSPSYTIKSLNSFDLRTKPLSCITTMHYLPHTIIGLRKNPLIISVPLCMLVQSMKNNLKELVFPRENQLDNIDMSTLLQLVQDMNNHMIAYERKGMSPLSPLELHPLLHPPLEIRLKIIFSLKLSCLEVGVTSARNTTRKPHVR